MARNEEKQLARLNRYYLEKQKQEELKKRPPRPRLDRLNTPRELRKWLPTITQDIEFYVKQMEVTCYTDSKIEEFQERIQRLKQEYRAYLHKLRVLEPEASAASWADRPYATRKRHANSGIREEGEDAESSEEPQAKSSQTQKTAPAFVPISTPVLQNMPSVVNLYNFEKPTPLTWNVNPDTEDEPLQFGPSRTLAISQFGEDYGGLGTGESSVDHGSCTGETNIDHGSGTGETSVDHGSCTGETSVDHGSGTGETSVDHGSRTGKTSVDHGSGTGETSVDHGSRTGETSVDHGLGIGETSVDGRTEDQSFQFGPSGTLAISQYASSVDKECESLGTSKSRLARVRPETEDQPLQFGSSRTLSVSEYVNPDDTECDGTDAKGKSTTVTDCGDNEASLGGNTHTGSTSKCVSDCGDNEASLGGNTHTGSTTKCVSDCGDNEASLGGNTHTGSTAKCVSSIKADLVGAEKHKSLSSCGCEQEVCNFENKSKGALPSSSQVRSGECICTTAGGKKVLASERRAMIREGCEEVSSSCIVNSHTQQLSSSNPLNLDYSDSSDEDL